MMYLKYILEDQMVNDTPGNLTLHLQVTDVVTLCSGTGPCADAAPPPAPATCTHSYVRLGTEGSRSEGLLALLHLVSGKEN